MTTLHFAPGSARLRRRALLDRQARSRSARDFPHAMRIHVVTNVAVGAVVVDGRRIAVTADGTLLRDVSAAGRAAGRSRCARPPAGARLTERQRVAAVAALGAAPSRCARASRRSRRRQRTASRCSSRTARALFFGDAQRLRREVGRRRRGARRPARRRRHRHRRRRSPSAPPSAACRTARRRRGSPTSDAPASATGATRTGHRSGGRPTARARPRCHAEAALTST